MNTMKTTLFGEVTIDDDGAYVPRQPDEEGRTRRPSLFVPGRLSSAQLVHAESLVDDVPSLDERARRALVEHVERGDARVMDFITFHREEFDASTVALLLGDTTSPSKAIERLDLVGLSVRDEVFVLDYSFGPSYTDQLLVVAFDAGKTVVDVMHES